MQTQTIVTDETQTITTNENGVTEVFGLELKSDSDAIQFVPHLYVGKEPDLAWIYREIIKVANQLGVPPRLHVIGCSDEENTDDLAKRVKLFDDPFSLLVPGAIASRQGIHVALNKGHSSHLIEVNTPIGVYKHSSGRILLGKVESERDGVLRPTCGALSHVACRYLESEKTIPLPEGELDFITILEKHLMPFRAEFLAAYNKGRDDAEKFSLGMAYLTWRNCQVQMENAVRFVADENLSKPTLVFGTITFNRFKYTDTSILREICLVRGNEIYNLSHPHEIRRITNGIKH